MKFGYLKVYEGNQADKQIADSKEEEIKNQSYGIHEFVPLSKVRMIEKKERH